MNGIFLFTSMILLKMLSYFLPFIPEKLLDVECQETDFNIRVKNNLIHSIGEYKAPWWYSPHLAVMIPFGHDYKLKYEKEILEDDDGGCVATYWFPSKPEKDIADIKFCVLLPCLGGESTDKFIQNFAVTMWTKSYYTVIVSARGAEIPLRNKIAWHPGFVNDALLTLRYIFNTYKLNPQIFMTGFSAGTTILFRTLLENQKCNNPVPVLGVCVVCIVGNYLKVRDNLQNSMMGRLYSYCMASKHKQIISKNRHVFDSDKVSNLLQCNSLCEFDTAAYQEIYGFNSQDELNDAFSCIPISHLNLPILGIQPRDDPLHDGKAKTNNRIDILKKNSQFIYVETKRGSHFGFFEGENIFEAFSNKECYTYPAKCAILFFDAILDILSI